MDWRNDKVEGPFRVDADLEFAGMVVGTLIVASKISLRLTGTADDLVVESGARAIVHGTVNGTILNEGGYVEVHGKVGSIDPAANIRIFPGAMIGEVR